MITDSQRIRPPGRNVFWRRFVLALVLQGIASMLEGIRKGLERTIASLCISFLAMIIVCVAIGIVTRYVLNNPVGWTEELSIYLQVWLTFMGIPLGVLYLSHMSINFLPERLKSHLKFLLPSHH